MGVQGELVFSKFSDPLDSLSDGAKAMLWLVLHIEAISHLHASQAIEKAEKWVEGIDKDSSSLKKAQKNLAQKLKLPNKYDRQAWELPNIFLEELIAGGFLFIKSKRATKTTTTPFSSAALSAGLFLPGSAAAAGWCMFSTARYAERP